MTPLVSCVPAIAIDFRCIYVGPVYRSCLLTKNVYSKSFV